MPKGVKGFQKGNSGRKKGAPNKIEKIDATFILNKLGSFMSCIKNGDYYVYRHYLDDKIVYIGKGKTDRAWSKNRTSKDHIDIFDKLKIDIFISGITEEEALCIEKALILLHKPIFNTVHSLKACN